MIKSFSLSELAVRCHGEVIGEDVSFERVSTDSRLCEGALFVALKGERFDGHDYVANAQDNNCVALVVEAGDLDITPRLEVTDSRVALGWAGALNREAFRGKVVALTGSSGKTTTKSMLASVLSQSAKVCATQANFNNEIGVPMTLLDIDESASYAVVEMGARHLGDIAYLGQFVQPDIAMVLNVGTAHLGEFGSTDNIARTKGEIYQHLKANGTAVINIDDAYHQGWQDSLKGQGVLTFSLENSSADLWAEDVVSSADGSQFKLCFGEQRQLVSLPYPGRHNVSNALAAAAAAIACGLDLDLIASGLSCSKFEPGRLSRKTLSGGGVVIDDTYNANPESMKAALDVLSLSAGKTVAVLGEMGELGGASYGNHVALAQYAKSKGISVLYCVGEYADEMCAAFGREAHAYKEKNSLVNDLMVALDGSESVLVKGSRSAGMESVVTHLLEGLH